MFLNLPAAKANGKKILEKYHIGMYNKGEWSCCHSNAKESLVCDIARPERTSSMPEKSTNGISFPFPEPSDHLIPSNSQVSSFETDSLSDMESPRSSSNKRCQSTVSRGKEKHT